MPRKVEFDAFKGILICLIILGHNTFYSDYYPTAFSALYNFHVASFLLFPCLFVGASASRYQIKDRLTRYLVPQFVFFAIACAAFFLFFISKDSESTFEWLGTIVLAVLINSEGTYRIASGFGFFWFLPALLTLVLLRTFYYRGETRRQLIIIVVACAVHMLLGFTPKHWLPWVPWGIPLALFLFPVGLLVGKLWGLGINTMGYFLFFLSVFLVCIYLGLIWPSSVGLAGDPRVYAINHPLSLVFHDVYLVSAFLALLLGCWHLPNFLRRALAYIGDRSLFVFLVHPFVFQALKMIGVLELMEFSSHYSLVSVTLSFLVTLLITLALNRAAQSMPRLYGVVFPRSYESWKGELAKSAA